MAKLSYKERKKMPKSEFALPSEKEGGKGGYPIQDKSHARNALARVAQHGSPAEKSKVRAAVHRKYPSIGKDKHGKRGMTHRDPETHAPRHKFDYGLVDRGGGGRPIPGYAGAGRYAPPAGLAKRVPNQSHQAEPGSGEGLLGYGESNPGRFAPLNKGAKYHPPDSLGEGFNAEAHSSAGKRWAANPTKSMGGKPTSGKVGKIAGSLAGQPAQQEPEY